MGSDPERAEEVAAGGAGPGRARRRCRGHTKPCAEGCARGPGRAPAWPELRPAGGSQGARRMRGQAGVSAQDPGEWGAPPPRATSRPTRTVAWTERRPCARSLPSQPEPFAVRYGTLTLPG